MSALSLAASVFSVIQISKDAIGIYSDLLETGSVSQYQATEAAARSLGLSIRSFSSLSLLKLTNQNLLSTSCMSPYKPLSALLSLTIMEIYLTLQARLLLRQRICRPC